MKIVVSDSGIRGKGVFAAAPIAAGEVIHQMAGERVGLIKFGSRVDVFLPVGVEVKVKVGDRVRGGSSVLAERPTS